MIFILDQLLLGLIAGLFGGIVVLIIALLMPKKNCPACGKQLPKFRAPKNSKQALWGGWTCPYCNAEIDRAGKIVNKPSSNNQLSYVGK